MKKEELVEIIDFIEYFKTKYNSISNALKLKNVNWLNQDGNPMTMLEISKQVIKDFESLSNIIYDNSKRY